MPNKFNKNQHHHHNEMDSYQVRTLQKKRTTNFREDETKLLISLWGSPVIQNKLYLTHRKAPVMRLLAANMQQRGFYRSPDEIKTRIRNLKCLYHRIKRTMVTGSGIGTVDPDWPHFKAMDAILGKENNGQKGEKNKQAATTGNAAAAPNINGNSVLFKDEHGDVNNGALEGPRCEDIKQEIELDINDDMESWNGNDSLGASDYEDNHISATSIVKTTMMTPTSDAKNHHNHHVAQQLPTILPNIAIPTAQQSNLPSAIRSNGAIPLPLLILNHGIHSQSLVGAANDKQRDHGNNANGKTNNNNNNNNNNDGAKSTQNAAAAENSSNPDLANILREILNVQSQQLELEKQKFELEKQRLEFDRVVGSQLMTLVPMVGGLLQRLVYPTVASAPVPNHPQNTSSSTPHNSVIDAADSAISCDDNEAESKPVTDYDILKDSKILRTVLERGIKKYMMADEARDKEDDSDNDNDNDEQLHDDNHLLIDHDHDHSNSNSK